ncbi:MAG: hypothetical protein E7505_03420, partial [Ruminococcus sp.]|nr:hypothetical protein [Ruminococcus sp.]
MKKNNKKTAIFLSSLLLVSGVAIGANMEKIANEFSTVVFADEEIYNGFKYVVSDGCVTITGYTEELDLTNVVIPEEIDGKPVTALGNSAFEGSKVEKVMVGTNVTTLGDRAFAECKSLKELNLGKNVKKLGKEVLASPYYGPDMQITKLIVSDNIEEVGENLYGRNSNHQTQITTLEVPASVTKVLPVFYNRSSLKVINAEEGGKSYSSEQGVLYNADKTKLVRCPVSTELEKYEVNEATETIGDNAFDSCKSLKELNLGKNVKKLGKEVLASPYYGPAMQITKLIVSDNIEEVGENLYGRNSNHQTQITTLEVPASVIKVLPVFYNRLSLKEINAEEGGKSYSSDQGVLYNADKTALVRCPASTELEKYEVNEATETIGDNAFDSCQSLKELNLGKNVKKLGKEVLASPYYGPAMQITKLIVSDNIEEVGESTYGRNSN